MRSRRVGTSDRIGAVTVFGRCHSRRAPLCRNILHAGAAVGDGERQRYPLGIAVAGQVVDGDGRRGRVDPADHRLACDRFTAGGQREGIDAVSFSGVAAAGDDGCAAAGRFHRHFGVSRRAVHADGSRFCPSGIVQADRQLRGDGRACSGGGNRHAFVRRHRHAFGIGGAGMEVICSGAPGGLDCDGGFAAGSHPAVGRERRGIAPRIFQLDRIGGSDRAAERAAVVGDGSHRDGGLGGCAEGRRRGSRDGSRGRSALGAHILDGACV